MSHEKHHKMIEALNACADECNHCAVACLEEKDVQSLVRCIKLDIDCAEICSVAASFAARGSDHMMHLMKACEELCDACAEECERHADQFEHCKKCAEACRHCAEECRAMTGEMA
jgi:hypothetical protein